MFSGPGEKPLRARLFDGVAFAYSGLQLVVFALAAGVGYHALFPPLLDGMNIAWQRAKEEDGAAEIVIDLTWKT